MVPAAGVEPATFRSGGERSNPLSYAGVSLSSKRNLTHAKETRQTQLVDRTSRRPS